MPCELEGKGRGVIRLNEADTCPPADEGTAEGCRQPVGRLRGRGGRRQRVAALAPRHDVGRARDELPGIGRVRRREPRPYQRKRHGEDVLVDVGLQCIEVGRKPAGGQDAEIGVQENARLERFENDSAKPARARMGRSIAAMSELATRHVPSLAAPVLPRAGNFIARRNLRPATPFARSPSRSDNPCWAASLDSVRIFLQTFEG